MNSQWQTYQALELIPDPLPSPQAQRSIVVRYLSRGWRSLLNRFDQTLTLEQQVERIEQCYDIEINATAKSWWRGLWFALNQPLFTWKDTPALDPQIWQSVDLGGCIYWHIYDPMTGQAAVLASETEVQIWLEEHIYS